MSLKTFHSLFNLICQLSIFMVFKAAYRSSHEVKKKKSEPPQILTPCFLDASLGMQTITFCEVPACLGIDRLY